MKNGIWCKPYGSMVAIVTPLHGDELDLEAFASLINWHAGLGTAAIVVAGTTGEAPTMDHDEQIGIVAYAVEISSGRIPIIAGIGSNSTKEAVRLTKMAESTGADAGLSIVPYYNKPTQLGLLKHFSAVADSSPDFPIILYDVKGRTGVSLEIETMLELARRHENIVGLKEANGDMRRMSNILSAFTGSKFVVYSGDDFTNFTAMMLGAWGTISVVSNVLPNMMAQMWDAGLNGQISKACGLHYRMMPMAEAMFLETNPIPVKHALALMGKIKPEIRLPMTELSEKNEQRLIATLNHFHMI